MAFTKKQIEDELKRQTIKGTPEEQKKKADWFKKHVEVITLNDDDDKAVVIK